MKIIPILSGPSLLALVAMLLPSAAFADAPMAIWQAEFQSINDMAGGPTGTPALTSVVGGKQTNDGDLGEAKQVPLPFDFSLLGSAPYSAFNVGSKGYITFGTHPTDASPSRNSADYISRTSAPKSLIAAWWGNHFCNPTGGIKTKLLGTTPHRQFVIEWDGCSKLVNSGASETTFQTQIWLLEGSNVVRVKYGNVAADPNPKWDGLSWGLKPAVGLGFMGPDANGNFGVCNPKGTAGGLPPCAADHFPRGSVIQYGRSPDADITARVNPGTIGVFPSTVELDVETILMNVGDAAIDGVGFDLHLATFLSSDPDAGGTVKVFTHPAAEGLAGGEARTLNSLVVAARPPNGTYRICAMLDPGNALGERDRTNNRVCSRDIIPIGPDLVVSSIGAAASGEPGGTVSFPITIRNTGNDAAGPFSYRVTLKPTGSDISIPPEVVLTKKLAQGLATGETKTWTETIQLPPIIRGEEYAFEIDLDVNLEIDEANRSNNHGRSTGTMINNRPQLKVSTPLEPVRLPDGCFFGEAITATFEVCNTGKAKAADFHPGVIMGNGTQVSLNDDVAAAAFPQFCGAPGTWNYTACEPIGTQPASCAFEYCRAECTSDTQCGSASLRCLNDPLLSEFLGREAKGCVNFLAVSTAPRVERCRTFTVSGKIPMEDQWGDPYEEGLQRFHVIDDTRHSLSQLLPDMIAGPEVLCRPAMLDVAAVHLQPAGRLRAGKSVAISRLVQNLGFTNYGADGVTRPESETFDYQYYLSSSKDISVRQIPLNIQSTGGMGRASIKRKGTNQRTDLVEIPSDVRPGKYYLGVILDPDNKLLELEKANNVFVFPEMVTVEAQGLEILTKDLPRANAGAHFSHTFVAVAGMGAYSWSAENLPAGMSMSESGILQGRPPLAGTFAFTARVTSGGAFTERLVALQVLPGQSELEVSTKLLPIAVKGSPYGRWYDSTARKYEEGAQLVASGGQPPYRWELDTGADNWMPQGLEDPTPEGLIKGQPTLMSESSEFLVRVRDALGNEAEARLEIVVVESGTLVLPSRALPLASSGSDYNGCIEAQGGDGAYHWSVESDTIPAGLAVETSGARACLVGMPIECGNFVVGVQVADDQRQSSTADVSLSVDCGVIHLNSRSVRSVSRGEEVEFQLAAVPSNEPTFRIYRGSLPSGLSLALDGLISGTVSDDASFRAHDVIIELRDADGRRSLSALTMSVNIEAQDPQVITTRKKVGCGSVGGSSSLSLLGLAVLSLRLVRRRAASSRIDSNE